MSDGAEGPGDVPTGSGTDGAVEANSAGRSLEDRDRRCRNCGTLLGDNYCPVCGQAADVHRTVSAWWHELAHSVLHFEGKFWRTLPLLLWRPGELTRRYVEGERVRFVSPMALFLFTTLLMFALFSLLGANRSSAGDGSRSQEVSTELRRIDHQIAGLERRQREMRDRGIADERLGAALRQAQARREALEASSGRGWRFTDTPDTGWARLDAGMRKANENPSLLLYKLQTNAYKFSWALIPISLPFLWLLFLHPRRHRQRFKAYDHLVFITYSLSFMSMLLIAFVLLLRIGLAGDLLKFAVMVVPPVHMYRQLRAAYELSWFSALWRAVALLFFASLSALIFLALLLAFGVFA